MGIIASTLRRLLFAPLISFGAEAAVAQAGSAPAIERTFLERSAIAAADDRCSLFSEGEKLALASGLLQVRNELLRANYDSEQVRRLGEEVSSHARSLGCQHPSILEVSATIRDSYRQFVKTNFLEFPGVHGMWEASRSIHDAWGTRQVLASDPAILGLRRDPESSETEKPLLLALSIPRPKLPPASVQILVRDPAKLSKPWLGAISRATGELSAPPKSVSLIDWASRQENEKDVTKDSLLVFYFRDVAINHIEALDPRESIVVEITPSPRDKDSSVKRILFEVGDFGAARRFALIPKPEAPPPEEQASANGH